VIDGDLKHESFGGFQLAMDDSVVRIIVVPLVVCTMNSPP
jgi:hypothetical protein